MSPIFEALEHGFDVYAQTAPDDDDFESAVEMVLLSLETDEPLRAFDPQSNADFLRAIARIATAAAERLER